MMTDSDYQFVLSLYLDGKTAPEVANITGKTRRTADRYRRELRDRGLLPDGGRPYPRLSDETLAKAQELLEDGSGYAEAARTLGVERNNLARRLPGYSLSMEEKIQRAVAGRVFNSIPDRL